MGLLSDEILGLEPQGSSDLKKRVSERLRKASSSDAPVLKKKSSYLDRGKKDQRKIESNSRKNALKSSLFSALGDLDDSDDFTTNSFSTSRSGGHGGGDSSDDDLSVESLNLKPNRKNFTINRNKSADSGLEEMRSATRKGGKKKDKKLRAKKADLLGAQSSHARIESSDITRADDKNLLVTKRLSKNATKPASEEKVKIKKSLQRSQSADIEGTNSEKPRRKSLLLGGRGRDTTARDNDSDDDSSVISTAKTRRRRSLSINFRGKKDKSTYEQQNSQQGPQRGKLARSNSFLGFGSASGTGLEGGTRRRQSVSLLGKKQDSSLQDSDDDDDGFERRPLERKKRSFSMGFSSKESQYDVPGVVHSDHSSSNASSGSLHLDELDCQDTSRTTEQSKAEGWLSKGMGMVLKPLEQLYDGVSGTTGEDASDDEDEGVCYKPSPDDEELPVRYDDEHGKVSTTGKLKFVAHVAVKGKRFAAH